MNIMIVGSRNFHDYTFLRNKCNEIIQKISDNDVTIISGGARGTDSLAEKYAEEYNQEFALWVMKAEWNQYGKKAGYLRNAEMVKISDYLIAFWDGKSKGTKHSIDLFMKKYEEPSHQRMWIIVV